MVEHDEKCDGRTEDFNGSLSVEGHYTDSTHVMVQYNSPFRLLK